RQRVPVEVELGLTFAVHDEGHCVVEWIERACAHRREGLAEKRELDDLHRSRRAARRLARHRGDARDPRVGENGRIECRGLFSLFRIPKEGYDLLHGVLLGRVWGRLTVSRTSSAREQGPAPGFHPVIDW